MPGLDHSVLVRFITSFYLHLEIFQNGLLKIKQLDKVLHLHHMVIITEKIMDHGLMALWKQKVQNSL